MNVVVDEVRGLAELDAFLSELPEALQRKMLYSALMTAAKPIMDQAKLNVARQFGMSMDYTGTLYRGITRGRQRKTGLAARVNVKLKRPKAQTKKRFAGPTGNLITKKYGEDPFYGRFLEMGTSKMAAKPWLKPAAVQRQADSGRAMNAALSKQVGRWCKAHGVPFKPGVS